MRLVSLVIPLYNEEDNVETLYKEICKLADTWSFRSEFIFIDDGSSDATVPRLETIVKSDPRATIVSFRRNFGQTAAMAAGFDYAQGEVIVTLDGDLQNVRVWSRALSATEVADIYYSPWLGSAYTGTSSDPATNRFFSPATFARLG